jgi:glutamyl-Q tRNA(Asp) synthetase
VSVNTATATTATDKEPVTDDSKRPPYVGRFAPSPTGSLHLGSLLAAVGSYVDARHNNGRWLLRIEDLDTPRVVPGSADEILRVLESFGLQWDGAVEHQSRNISYYEAALRSLQTQGHTFECSCTRKMLAGTEESGYPGTCRSGPRSPGPAAIRFRVDENQTIAFKDRVQGPRSFDLAQCGDFVIRRRDGVFTYQLAVVVDDARQGVTDVVRGADLLSSTPWQIALQTALNTAHPHYAHLPLIVEPNGTKLAKAKRSVPIDASQAAPLLVFVLSLMKQSPPHTLALLTPAEVLDWAIQHWDPTLMHGVQVVPLRERL